MIYTVPTTKAKQFLSENPYIVASDEGEAIALACGEYLVRGEKATVVMGENGFLNALDAIITLSQLHEIPIDLKIYLREDEPQHAMAAKGVRQILDIYQITAEIL